MTTTPPAAALTLTDLAEGTRAQVEFTITHQDMRTFATLSGDYNPLHLDDAFAKTKGFDGAVVYGALITAKISQLIGMRLPGRDSVWSSIALQFRKPLYVGDIAQAEGAVSARSESTGMIELSLIVRARGLVLAKGKAEVLLVSR